MQRGDTSRDGNEPLSHSTTNCVSLNEAMSRNKSSLYICAFTARSREEPAGHARSTRAGAEMHVTTCLLQHLRIILIHTGNWSRSDARFIDCTATAPLISHSSSGIPPGGALLCLRIVCSVLRSELGKHAPPFFVLSTAYGHTAH